MPEEQWTPRPLTSEVVLLDVSAVVDVAVVDKAIVGVGPVASMAVTWEIIDTKV